jgi:hypothetical protein
MGSAKPNPHQLVTVHEQSNQLHLAYRDMHHARPTWLREETKAKGRRVYLEKPRSSVMASDSGGSRRRRKWFVVAGDDVFLLSLPPLFFVLFSATFFFFFFQPSPSLFSSFSSLLCPLSSIFSPFSRPPFLFCPPVFIGKNRGGTWLGQPLCCRPSNKWKVLVCVGVFLMLFRRRKSVKTWGRKSSSSPTSGIQEKKKTYGAVQNGTIFASFKKKRMKRHRFSQNVSFHLNGNWRPNMSDSKLGLEFARVLHFGPWSRISSIKSLIGHQTSIFMQLSP